MNFKKYHVSRNLAKYWKSAYVTADGSVNANRVNGVSFPVKLEASQTVCFTNQKTNYGRGIAIFSGFDGETLTNMLYRSTNNTVTYTADSDCYVIIWGNYDNTTSMNETVFNLCGQMLNTGSEPLPYEPYSSEVWHDTPHYVHKTDTDTITTLPADIYPNAATATVGLKGNTVQNGTPTPDNPIMPEGTGELETNLAIISGDSQTVKDTYYKDVRMTDVLEAGTYTVSYVIDEKTVNVSLSSIGFGTPNIYQRDLKSFTVGYTPITITMTITLETEGCLWVRFLRASSPTDFSYSASHVRVEKGSHSYGIKIPISSANTTTPVYLGEVESTRRIKKLVLNGTERVSKDTGQDPTLYFLRYKHIQINSYCTHLRSVLSKPQSGEFSTVAQYDGYIFMNFGADIMNAQPSGNTIEGFKEYLAAQYAAGTPVTIWYVLATPETAVVNEPLRKIGDYADEVSGITIPVTAGANAVDVLTTLKPSEVTATYKGWHPVADVHVYPDSSWMPTSWEEFRKAVRSGDAPTLYPIGTKLYENWGDTTSDAWIVVDYPTGEDYLDSDLAQQGYTNRVMLMEEKLNYLRQFDAIEAWLYVETAIPVGAYRFTIPNYDVSYGGNKTYIFTSTANVPVGGQLTLTWAYQQNPSAVQAYSSNTSTSAIFNVSITEWDGTTPCIDLGTIKLAMSDADSIYGKLNHIHRARYGSNNYYQSGYRQWLNTNASANWWTPTNVFDRPYGNRTDAGRLNVMNSNMKSVLATPTVNYITNNLFEYPSLDGTTFSLQTAYTVTDKLFPVTHSEINLSSSPNVNSVLDYYVGKGNADRIKYRKDNGNAYYWWLRTPDPTRACTVRYVVTSGALNVGGASGTNGSAAACIIQ